MSYKHLPPLHHAHALSGRWRCAEGVCSAFTVACLLVALLLWSGSSPWLLGGDLGGLHEHPGLLPGFHLAEEAAARAASQGSLAQRQRQQHQQQQTPALAGVVADVPGYPAGPPYVLPMLIHQTVKDKSAMSCQVRESVQTWIDMNPGFVHRLYDDQDLVEFVGAHYPQLLDMFLALPTNIERTDTWRYLVLHKLGGVYADSDVKCMQPIETWNAEHGHDAALLVGIAKRNLRTGDTLEFNQFVMAAMPGHPVMAAMPLIIASNLAMTFLSGAGVGGHGRHHDAGILMRTGPRAFTTGLRLYAARVGAAWPVNSTRADEQGGVLFGSARAMPKFVFGAGWDTIDHNMTCAEVKRRIRPEALICHQFFGTWKENPEKDLKNIRLTYDDCAGAGAGQQRFYRPPPAQQQQQQHLGQQQQQAQQQQRRGVHEDGSSAAAAHARLRHKGGFHPHPRREQQRRQ